MMFLNLSSMLKSGSSAEFQYTCLTTVAIYVSALASVSFAMCILVFLLVIGYHAFSLRKVICSCRKDYEALDPEEDEQLLFCEREGLDPSLELVHPSLHASYTQDE